MAVAEFIKKFFSGQNLDSKDIEVPKDVENGESFYMPEVEENFLTTLNNIGLEYLPSGSDFFEFVRSCMKDPDIATQLENFKSKVKKARLEIKPQNDSPQAKKAAEMCQTLFDKSITGDFKTKALRSLEQGVAIDWLKLEQGKVSDYPYSIGAFQEPKVENFNFDPYGNLIRADNMAELPEPFWIITSYNKQQENRWGVSILVTLYWVLKFSKLSYKQIMVLQDKLGVPSFAALFKPSEDLKKDKLRIKEIATTLSNIRSHSGIAITAESIQKLEAQRGAVSEIIGFLRYMEEKKIQVIMGSILTSGTSNSSGASYNIAENHEEVTMDRAQAVADLLGETLTNQVLPILCKYNISFDFPVQDMPVASFVIDKVSSLDDLIKVGEKMPVKIKAATLKKMYNIPIENDDDEELEFSQSNSVATQDNFSGKNLANLFFSQKIMEKVTKNMQKNPTT
jgi:hypothetical protein